MLGTKFLEFSVIIEKSNIIRRIARPYLLEIYKTINETVGIFKWDGRKFISIDEIRSTSIPRISTNSYENLPIYCTAIGKLLLARKTHHELENYLNGIDFEEYTKKTITDIDAFKECIRKIELERVAYDNEECLSDVSSVAVSIDNIQGQIIACLNVVGPSSRLTMEKMKEIAPYLKECAIELSDKLGYSGELK